MKIIGREIKNTVKNTNTKNHEILEMFTISNGENFK